MGNTSRCAGFKTSPEIKAAGNVFFVEQNSLWPRSQNSAVSLSKTCNEVKLTIVTWLEVGGDDVGRGPSIYSRLANVGPDYNNQSPVVISV